MYLREKHRRPEDAHPRTAKETSGYRSFNPTLGRWLSRDPAGFRGGYNVYGFVVNSPLGLIDVIGWIPVAPPRLPKPPEEHRSPPVKPEWRRPPPRFLPREPLLPRKP